MSFDIGGTEFSNSGANDIAQDAIQLTFDDGDTPGSVRLTVDFVGGTGVDSSAFLNNLYLNVESGLSGFGFTHVSGVKVHGASFNSNGHGSGGSHGWDIKLDYPPPTGKQKLYVGMQSVYDITASGLTTSSFFGITNTSGNGPFEAMVHINAIDNGNSGHYADSENSPPPPPAVPEPHAFLVWSILMTSTLLRRSR